MEKDKKSEIHITNNFNAPIGQHIDHVDTIYFRMDGDGTFHFENVGKVNGELPNQPRTQKDSPTEDVEKDDSEEEVFKFIHPAITGEQERLLHEEVERLVKRQGIQEICKYLNKLKLEGKIYLPQSAETAYKELVRVGMPKGEGFNIKTFTKYYNK